MKKKILKTTIMISVIFTVLVSTSLFTQADNGRYKQTIDAWFNTLNISYDGQYITENAQPLLWNDTTYIPLRKFTEIFDKNITWDGTTNTVIITDKVDYELQNLYDDLNSKVETINELKSRIEELENEDDYIDLDDLEDNLNDDYNEYEDIEFDINLDGDEDDIEIEIEVDLDDYGDEWDDLSDSDMEDYLQDICDDILDEYEDADIEGSIIDTDEDEELVYFDIDSSGDVDINDNDDTGLDDLEDDLNYYYESYEDIEFYIYLSGDEDDIEVEIEVDLDDYGDEWDYLSDSDIEDYLQDICDDILDEYEDADITGNIIDTDEDEELVYFEINSSGSLANLDYSNAIENVEDDLNYYYESYEDIEFYIYLSGDEDDIEVEIQVDLGDYNDEWDNLSDSDIEDYLQDICDDILDRFEDADISGTIVDIDDIDDIEDLVYFETDSSGDVDVDYL
jgi:hypothetical protein